MCGKTGSMQENRWLDSLRGLGGDKGTAVVEERRIGEQPFQGPPWEKAVSAPAPGTQLETYKCLLSKKWWELRDYNWEKSQI